MWIQQCWLWSLYDLETSPPASLIHSGNKIMLGLTSWEGNQPDLDVSHEVLEAKEQSRCHNSSWCFGHRVGLTEDRESSPAGSPNSRALRWSCRIGCQTDSSKSPSGSWFLLSLTLHIQVLLVHRCSLFLNFGRHSWGQHHWKCSLHDAPGNLITMVQWETKGGRKPSLLVSKVLGEAWYQDWFGLISPLWQKLKTRISHVVTFFDDDPFVIPPVGQKVARR